MAVPCDRAPIEPLYGPLMTDDMFNQRWALRFRFWGQGYLKQPHSLTQSVLVICDMSEAGLHGLENFIIQATQHVLGGYRFPAATSKEYSDDVGPMEVVAGSDDLFASFKVVMLRIDPYVRRLRQMKLGRTVSGIAWQSMPLSVRQRLNDIFERVRLVEDEEGWWGISDDKRKVNEKGFADRQLAGPWWTL